MTANYQTRDALQDRLDAYLAAELKILSGQEYQIGDGAAARKLRRADLSVVQAEIRRLRAEIAVLDQAAAPVAGASAASARRGGRIVYARPAR